MSRRRTLTGLAVVSMLILGFVGSDVQAGHKGQLVLRIQNDMTTFETTGTTPPGGAGAFYVRGTICKDPDPAAAECETNGDFHCWGWIPAAGGPFLVSQEFIIDGRGAISVQGIEDFGATFVNRSVVGGTHKFRNVRGEMISATPPDGGEFVVTFKLIGAR